MTDLEELLDYARAGYGASRSDTLDLISRIRTLEAQLAEAERVVVAIEGSRDGRVSVGDVYNAIDTYRQAKGGKP